MALKRTAITMYDLTKNNRQTSMKLKIDRSNIILWTGKMRNSIIDPHVNKILLKFSNNKYLQPNFYYLVFYKGNSSF